ncbi:MAG: FHA domain-containing protein [Lachnospiraceae bacterium]|nr:FHA domain-containing protein [Lachnospiraceae bacterium]
MDEIMHCRIMGKNCLKVSVSNEDRKNYIYKMWINNPMEGFVKGNERIEDGINYLVYYVDTLKPINAVYKEGMLNLEELSHLIFSVCKTRERLRKYMLPGLHIILSEKYIYKDLDSSDFSFVYLPLQDVHIENTLADYLIGMVDYDDEELVEAIYDVYTMKDDEGWPEVLRQRLINLREQRRIFSVEPTDNVSMDRTFMAESKRDGNLEKPKEVKPDRVKDALCYGGIYLVVTSVAVYSIIEEFLLENYEVILLGVGVVAMSLLAATIITRVLTPSIYERIMEVIGTKNKRKEKKSEETDFGNTLLEEIITKEADYGKTVYIEAPKPKNMLYGQGDNHFNIDLNSLPITIGRMEGNADIVINNKSISKLHAKIYAGDEGILIEDLYSTNGTIKNGIRLAPGEAVPLNLKDDVTLGNLDFVFA